jgi:hypothetical protein
MDLPIPENEALKRAVKWIHEELLADSDQKRSDLVQHACLRFDLSPSEAEFLTRAVKIDHVPDKNSS